MAATLGVDIGSIATKAAVHDPRTGVVSFAAERYKERGVSDLARLDADAVLAAAIKAMRSAAEAAAGRGVRIQAIGFSSILYSVVLLDADHAPLPIPGANGGASSSPPPTVLTYADERARNRVRELAATDSQAIYERTGCVVHPSYPLWTLAWLSRNHPHILRCTRRIVSPAEYVIGRLTGSFERTSRSTASASGLLSLATGEWDDELAGMSGVPRDALPRVVEPTDCEPLSASAASELGLAAGLPVAIGGGDGMLAHVGTGATREWMATLTLGTTGAVRQLSTAPLLTRPAATWCYRLLPGAWVAGSAITSGGNCIEWLRESMAFDAGDGNALEARLDDHLRSGPVVVPFLHGERGPGWHAGACAVATFSAPHDAASLALGFMEGVAFNLRQCIETLPGPPPTVMRMTGGALRMPLWVRMLADVLGRPIALPAFASQCGPDAAREHVAVAAALVAQRAIGAIDDFSESAIGLDPLMPAIQPDPARHGLFTRRYERYLEAYRLAIQGA